MKLKWSGVAIAAYKKAGEEMRELGLKALRETPDGLEVEICSVESNGPDDLDNVSYKWPDRRCVGPVVKWLRAGRQGRRRQLYNNTKHILVTEET